MMTISSKGVGTHTASRRQILKWGAAGALGATAAMLPLSRSVFAQSTGAGSIRLIHASPAILVLWSVTFLAEDMGFYKEEGLDFARIPLNGGPVAMTALLAGEGDANCSAPGELLSANARGQRVKVIESYTNSDAYTLVVTKAFADAHGVTAQSTLAEREAALKAAKGAKFGITAPGSQTDLTTRMALAQVGLDPTPDAAIEPLHNIVNVSTALGQGAIDGGAMLSPFTEQVIAEFGIVPLLSIAAGDIPAGSRLQGQVLEARPDDIEANPDSFAAMVRADLKALRMIVETPDEARDKLRATRFGSVDEAIWPAVWAGQLPTFRSPFVTEDSLRAWLETGTIGGNPDPATFPYADVIDMQFVEAGLMAIGWTPPA